MTDLHTHILPGIDDGARDAAVSTALLRLEYEQGADTVALTPHFYPERENAEAFLMRRSAAYEALEEHIASLPEEERAVLPRRRLGAEVAWVPGISELLELPLLCYEGTSLLLLELPFCRWDPQLFRELNDIMNRRALTPVIAHIDRYMGFQNRRELGRILDIGLPVQLSAAALTVPLLKRSALKLLRESRVNLLISDCHDLKQRRPNLDVGYDVIEKKLGGDFAAILKESTDLLTQNAEETD